MTHRTSIPAFFAGALALAAAPAFAQGTRAITPLFTRDIVPIFERSCQRCHRGDEAKGGLKLDSFDNILQGGAKGPVILPGNPDKSRLIMYVDGRLQPRMPVGGAPLRPAEIAVLRNWIALGAKNDPGAAGAAPVA